jgi:hypothetical protein
VPQGARRGHRPGWLLGRPASTPQPARRLLAPVARGCPDHRRRLTAATRLRR